MIDIPRDEQKKHEKILFELEKDSEGYPPDDWESLWAFKVEDDLYAIDNIPFYVRGISPGDIIAVRRNGDEFFFRKLIITSGHTVIRVIVFDISETETLTKNLTQMACDFEGSHIDGFVAFDCPPEANYSEVEKYLQEGEDRGRWEYEVSSLRH